MAQINLHRALRVQVLDRAIAAFAAAGIVLAATVGPQQAQPRSGLTPAQKGAILLAAYPDTLAAIEGNVVVFRDGTRLPSLGPTRLAEPFRRC